ncbi:MAG: DUF4347 domain-containing protein, partial [bacterium]|nr:DUF4347 domain-containing protein [bacterium]
FIDTTVNDYESLLAGIKSNVEIFYLDPNRDGIEQIAEVLDGRSGIDAIHLITEGESAQLRLGSSLVTQESINGQYADLFARIGSSLDADADLLIYGCNFGEGIEGAQAAATLAALTGADVAASDDLTGHRSLGGDWDLEVRVGDIESGPLIDQQARDLWVNALALPTAANNTVSTHEDSTYTFAVNDFGYSDPDADVMASVKITSLETLGALQLNGVDVTLNQVITKADIDADLLTFAPVADGNGAGYDSFGFSVNDGTSDSASTYTMTVDVLSVNDAPVFTALDDTAAFTEGDTAVVLDADVSIADSELDALNSGNGDYHGASVTLARNGGVSTEDVFGFNPGNGITLSGANLIKNSQVIASFDITTIPGELVVTFTNVNGETPT